ncbi:MAG TPA: iron-sulfur cluster repair di-iron protein [Pyrinomonadaceae bacterium]|jgi:regulator of cell morphogenesis and NO signaling|nr:iron-sulfur cluster repair di-iron protein [Pyrinomonadaceae bacterium]
MLLDPMKTVREVAVALPNATRVFEKTKIDYCCGGDQLLGAACAKAGVDLETLQRMLETTAEPARPASDDFQSLSAGELITYILDKHHVYTRDEMTRLEALVEKVVNAHGANHSELMSIRDLLQQLFAELKGHMFKEEQILFPFIVELEQSVAQQRPAPFAPFGTVNNPIRMMRLEHDNAGEILRELRKLSRDYRVPANACMSYETLYKALEAFEQDLHQHIHLENNILFPKTLNLEARV